MLPDWRLPDHGALFVVTGPSGAGKSTLISSAMKTIPGLAFSVSATTRHPRSGETDGVDYHFINREQFGEWLEADAFLEHATVYDEFYGTPIAPVRAALADGRSLILDIDVQGAAQVRSRLPEAVTVFIAPPDLASLQARLEARGTDSPEKIAKRMKQVSTQILGCGDFDYLVLNSDLVTGQAAFQGVILAELCRRGRRESLVKDLRTQVAGSGHTTHGA